MANQPKATPTTSSAGATKIAGFRMTLSPFCRTLG
jgi:hypothetical protein